MKLGPLPPKPSLLPPFWWLAPIAAVLSLVAFAANVMSAYDHMRMSNNGWLAFHCALMAWMLMAFVSDVKRTIVLFRKWHELRVEWERLRALRETLEDWQQGKQ
ncbi:hypothetical protein ACGYQ5_14290 [Burkholderia pseudomallei]